MANDNMPFVAIIGGIWQLPPAEADDARMTTQEIGAALATAGMAHPGCLSRQQTRSGQMKRYNLCLLSWLPSLPASDLTRSSLV